MQNRAKRTLQDGYDWLKEIKELSNLCLHRDSKNDLEAKWF